MNCETRRSEDLHPYTKKLLRVRALRVAGYPLTANDLAMEEWFDLAELEHAINEQQHDPD